MFLKDGAAGVDIEQLAALTFYGFFLMCVIQILGALCGDKSLTQVSIISSGPNKEPKCYTKCIIYLR